MAGKAALQHCGTSWLAVVEMTVPPTARRRVLFRILDHKLNPVRGWTRHERLSPAKGFIIFLRRYVTPCQPGNDRALRKRKRPISISLDRYVIPQNGANIVELAFFVGHGDQLPVSVSRGNI